MTAQGDTNEPGERTEPSEFGRVDEDGTVYVRVGDEERVVGQYPEGTPQEALAFFTKRYDALAFEVQLLEQRIRGGAMSPDEATESINRVSAQLVEPQQHPQAVRFGVRVRLRRSDGGEVAYRLVGEDEAEPARGSLSWASPLAQSLLGKEVGDTVPFQGGKLEIAEIES